MSFTLPKLPYLHNSLEPHIDARTMEIHHGKHHQGYTDKLNTALESVDIDSDDATELLSNLDSLPEKVRTAVRNNGGGYVNHNLFWEVMAPDASGEPEGKLADAIDRSFNNFNDFKSKFTDAATTRFGSGWAWLCVKNGELLVHSTANQDSPYLEGMIPILGLDVWEHAYYLKYQNRRPDYIEAWWNVVNWEVVTEKFKSAKG